MSGSASATNEPSRASARLLPVVKRGFTGHDRGHVALGPLDEASGTAGQVEHELRKPELQRVEVDDVEVGPVAVRDDPAITEPVQPGGVARHLAHDQFD